jgi:NADH:ubiquinone oxidoreductase subunit 3 (subunit A)
VTLARALGAMLFIALVAPPALGLACPVCVDPREANQSAFISMTIFMSLLPLGVFAGLVLWIRKRVRVLERAERHEAAAERP